MSKHFTIVVQMFEVVDEPAKVEYRNRVEAVKVSKQAGNFTVRDDTLAGAVRKAIGHLNLELPDYTVTNGGNQPIKRVPRAGRTNSDEQVI